jgi:hypothetical protein
VATAHADDGQNNLQVAALIQEWLAKQGLVR